MLFRSGAHRFGIKGKLAPRYIGPFTILERRGKVAYQLQLPPNLSQVHDVFHVSQLRGCFKDPVRAVDHEVLELQQTSPIKSIRSAFSTKLNAAHVRRRSSSSKSSGRITLKTKPPGNARIVYEMNIPHSFLLPPKSRDEISCSGGDL